MMIRFVIRSLSEKEKVAEGSACKSFIYLTPQRSESRLS